jgi:hypothetical protein
MFKPGDKVIVARSKRRSPNLFRGRIEGKFGCYYVGDKCTVVEVLTSAVVCKIRRQDYHVDIEELEYDTKLAKYLAGAHE